MDQKKKTHKPVTRVTIFSNSGTGKELVKIRPDGRNLNRKTDIMEII